MTGVALQILSRPKRANDPRPEEITPARTLQVAPELPEQWAVFAGESRRETRLTSDPTLPGRPIGRPQGGGREEGTRGSLSAAQMIEYEQRLLGSGTPTATKDGRLSGQVRQPHTHLLLSYLTDRKVRPPPSDLAVGYWMPQGRAKSWRALGNGS